MRLFFFLLSGCLLVGFLASLPSCKASQSACPAYKDFSSSLNKEGTAPQMPKVRKAKSGIYPGGKRMR